VLSLLATLPSPQERIDHHDHAASDHDRIEQRGVEMHRQAIDQRLGEKGAGKRHAAIRPRPRSPSRPPRRRGEGRKLGDADADRDDRIGRHHRRTFEPAAISSDRRMIPAPTVPPASGPQPNAAAARPRSVSAIPRRRIKRRSGTLAISIEPITMSAPAPLSLV